MSLMWSMNEAKSMTLKDDRKVSRAMRMLETFARLPSSSIPMACASQAEIKAAYRFFGTNEIDEQDILNGHYQATANRIRVQTSDVFIASDGMDASFNTLKQTKGLGSLGGRRGSRLGIKIHNTMAFNKKGIPLGLIYQKYWTRNIDEMGKRRIGYKRKSVLNKETVAWLEALEAIERVIPQEMNYTMIADGHADTYDLLSAPRRQNSTLLIHLVQNRNLNNDSHKLFEKLELADSLGIINKTDLTINQSV
jgi:hypothetical protein